MPAHPEYTGPLKVKVLPAGICGSDFAISPGKLGMRNRSQPPAGYESVKDAAKRLGLAVRAIYRLCKQNRLEHKVSGWDRTRSVFIKKGSIPTTDGGTI